MTTPDANPPMSIAKNEAAFAKRRQRAAGVVRAVFARAGERSQAQRVFETGGLRLRFPRAGAECEAVIVNTGGGMSGGDRAEIELSTQANARALITTQAAEKIYRADGAPARMSLRIDAGAASSLTWAPQETLLFEGSNLVRRLEADVAGDASLLILESVVFGRLAHGEVRVDAAFSDDWRIRRDGRLVFAEALRLTQAGARLDRAAVGAGARALATVLWLDAQAAVRLEDLRQALEGVAGEGGERVEAGVSAFDGMLLARLASPAPQRLRAALVAAMQVLRGRAAPRVWA